MRRRLLPCLGLVLMLFGAWAASAAQKPIDLLVTGGIVITMAGPDIGRGSVAIDKGVIVAVGPSSEVDHRYKPTQRIDAAGTAVIPGLINAHTHGAMTLFRGIADDRALMDWLQNFIFPAEARNVDRDFVKWGTRLAAAEMIASGTTTYVDMYYFEADVARETRRAGLRGILGETVLDFPAPDNKTWDAVVAYCRKFVAEYKNDRLITPALAPHAPYTVSQEHLQEVRRLATELHVPILIHVAETKDELKEIAEKHNGMGPGQYLDSIGFLGPDVLAAHCVWLTPAEIATFAARGVGVAHCPESNSMLASGVAPVTEMRKAGVHVGLGTDGPAGSNNNLDMIEEMASAARLQKVFRGDPQAISARDVLAMATIDGARAIGMQSKIGSLEVGKRADLAIIDLQEPKAQPVYSVESAIVYATSGDNVVTTICDGHILMRNHKLLTVDVPRALAKAKEYRRKVQESLEKRH